MCVFRHVRVCMLTDSRRIKGQSDVRCGQLMVTGGSKAVSIRQRQKWMSWLLFIPTYQMRRVGELKLRACVLSP